MKNNPVQQRRRFAIVLLLETLLVFSALGYVVFSFHSMKSDQIEKYEGLEKEFNDLSGSYEEEIENLKRDYELKIEAMDVVVNDLQEDYSEKLVKLSENEDNEIILQQLKDELNTEDLSDLAEKASKASVTINADNNRGSGAIISRHGHIVTNYHLVIDVDEIKIKNNVGVETIAEIVAVDEKRDIAIIKSQISFVNYFKLADSAKVRAGDRVLAIGNPQRLDFTVTQGIVSATERVFDHQEGEFIQTDVPINIGSSGGPLVNSNNELIGINTFKIKGSESLGFAVPSNDIKKLLDTV